MLSFWPEFMLFAAAHVFSLISPGPDFLMVVQSSLRFCRRTAIWVAFGISCGELIHVSYCLMGIGWLITRSLWLFTIMKWLGAAYLVYIGISALRAKKPVAISEGGLTKELLTPSLSPRKAFARGFFTNVLNAKAAFFTLSFFTVLVSPETPLIVQLIYGAFIQITTFVWFCLVAIFLTNPTIQHHFYGIKHWIERISGAILIALGLKLSFFEFGPF